MKLNKTSLKQLLRFGTSFAISNGSNPSVLLVINPNSFESFQQEFFTCGNDLQELSEGCDDGNVIDGDGCSSLCQIESGYECVLSAFRNSTCGSICGDHILVSNQFSL